MGDQGAPRIMPASPNLSPTTWGERRLTWGERTYVMGILNITPDSFADAERLEGARAVAAALAMEAAGADMIDVGAESTRPGARPIDADPSLLVSPCDAIVGACGAIAGTTAWQVKGFPYTLEDLGGGQDVADAHRNGCYATLRLTAGMYHRFHAPHDCRVEQVTYVRGDTWNVNPIALKRIEKLFCKNERAVLRTRLNESGCIVTLVPVAAVLVAGIRLHFLDALLDMDYQGQRAIACDTPFAKGDEIGWFQHGSTIVLLAPAGFTLCANVREGEKIRMGQPLMRLPATA